MDRMPGYEGWSKRILKYVETDNSLWRSIDKWLYPKNGVVREHLDHLCEENYKRGISSVEGFDKCKGCNEVIPDGIKMIALLEKL